MRNTKTKIKFTDIAGMLERDQMREIIGGCGTSGSGAYKGDTSIHLNQYAGADSTFSSFMSSAGFIGMMGQGGTAGVFGADPTGTSVSSSLNSYVYNSAFMADLNKPKSIQVGATTITDPAQIAQVMANLTNQYNETGTFNLSDPNLTMVSGQGYYYNPTITYNLSVNGMQSGKLGELTIFTFKTPVALTPANPFSSQLIYNPYDGSFNNYYSGAVSTNNAILPDVPMHGSFSKPTPLEAAIMSKYVYGGPDAGNLEGGWKVSTAVAGLVLNDPASGFKSQLFEKLNPSTGLTEFCYVTAGTDLTSVKDWGSNALQLVGLSRQYQESTDNAMALKEILGDALSFAGHSLGGGLAEANAIATGDSAVTFNAAGLTVFTTGLNFKSDTDAYIMTTDPLNGLQQSSMLLPTAGGNIHALTPVGISGYIDGHSIDTCIASLRPH